MSTIVQFYNVSKRRNSFFRPATEDANITLNVNLKSPCSVLNPRIEVASATSTFNPTNWNYCRIDAFNDRYYFVDTWTWENGMWIASMSVDVLASFKEEISGKSYFFVRSSVLYDDSLPDMMYPVRSAVSRQFYNVNFWGDGTQPWEQGCVVFNMIGSEGTTNFYWTDPTTFGTICSDVFGNLDWLSMDWSEVGVDEGIAKLVFDPFEYFVSAKWFPVRPTSATITEVEQLSIGWWNLPVSGVYRFDQSQVVRISRTQSLTNHPSYSSRGQYVNKKPFTTVYVTSPLFGGCELDSNIMDLSLPLQMECMIDFGNGASTMTIGQNGMVMANLKFTVGLDLMLTSLRYDALGTVGGVFEAIGSLFSGEYIGAVAGIGTAIDAGLSPDVRGKGGNGGALSAISTLQIVEIFRLLTDFDDPDNGRPSCKNGIMQTLGSGYYMIENGNVSIQGALNDEMRLIKDLLEGGVYYV